MRLDFHLLFAPPSPSNISQATKDIARETTHFSAVFKIIYPYPIHSNPNPCCMSLLMDSKILLIRCLTLSRIQNHHNHSMYQIQVSPPHVFSGKRTRHYQPFYSLQQIYIRVSLVSIFSFSRSPHQALSRSNCSISLISSNSFSSC